MNYLFLAAPIGLVLNKHFFTKIFVAIFSFVLYFDFFFVNFVKLFLLIGIKQLVFLADFGDSFVDAFQIKEVCLPTLNRLIGIVLYFCRRFKRLLTCFFG